MNNTWKELIDEIKYFLNCYGIKTNVSLKRLEVSTDGCDRFSSKCYYRIRKKLYIYIDWDFLRNQANEMILLNYDR